ncbi:hypothetical protein EV421DRAFT_1906490 [Armillaria borealis]|uniref:Uncharacterized protein n=1 Tax=Armillaria borealis TaxID=47425 RepID=A0AA39MLE0_9AGAR|nr:hypothetical protein EV421DRAFT_1906490 [Armillaria borealis]
MVCIVGSRTLLEIISGIKGLEVQLKIIVEQSSIPVLSKMFSKILFLLPALFGIENAGPTQGGADTTSVRSLDARDVAPVLDFTHSTWIWTGEQTGSGNTSDAPAGVRPFRKAVPSSSTKCPVCATIIISCPPYTPVYSFVFTVGLDPEGHNVVAIAAIAGGNIGGPAGLIVTMLVDYSDGTTEMIVSDNTWKTMKAVPLGGWTSPSYNDSAWTPAVSEGPTANTYWKSPILPPALNMTGVHWIQTDESGGSAIGLGQRPFRKTITSPYGKAAVCGKVVLSAEDSYTLYVNGKNIGSGSGWTKMQACSVPELDTDMNLVAVSETSAGVNDRVYLAASMLVAFNDGT